MLFSGQLLLHCSCTPAATSLCLAGLLIATARCCTCSSAPLRKAAATSAPDSAARSTPVTRSAPPDLAVLRRIPPPIAAPRRIPPPPLLRRLPTRPPPRSSSAAARPAHQAAARPLLLRLLTDPCSSVRRCPSGSRVDCSATPSWVFLREGAVTVQIGSAVQID